MQISIETTSALERRLTISVPSEEFEQQITDKLTNVARDVRLAGFRPGKVPLKEVRRRFGQGVRAEVAGDLMQSSFLAAIAQESLSPAGSPSLEVVKMDPGIDFEFTATFEVFPAIELKPFDALSVKRPEAEISAADIDSMIDRLRQQRQTYEEVERGAADGDRITVDFQGTIDGEPFEGGAGEGVSFLVGQGQMIGDFDAGVRGAKAGEHLQFDATFPDDYQAETLRGRTATFSVEVQAVAEPRIPDLDAGFFESFGVDADEGDLDAAMTAFRAEVESNMAREMTAAIRSQVKQQVLDQLAELHEVPLPETMVHSEIHALKHQMEQRMRAYAQGQALPDLGHDMFREEAEKRVKIGLLVNQIVTRGEIEADGDKVRARIEEIASSYAEPQQVVSYYYANEEQLRQVEMAVLEEQVIDTVLDGANIETVDCSYDEVVSGTAIAPAAPPQSETSPQAAADDPSRPEDAVPEAPAQDQQDETP